MQDLVVQPSQLQGLTAKCANARNLQKTALVLAMAMVVSPSYGGDEKYCKDCKSGGYYAVTIGGKDNQTGDGVNDGVADYSAVIGGVNNVASGENSGVLAGKKNTAHEEESVVVGGSFNETFGFGSAILGGWANRTKDQNSAVVGGASNHANGRYSAVMGGAANRIGDESDYSIIVGGKNNRIKGKNAGIFAGVGSVAEGDNAIVIGYGKVKGGGTAIQGRVENGGVAINGRVKNGGTAIAGGNVENGGIAIGSDARATKGGMAIGGKGLKVEGFTNIGFGGGKSELSDSGFSTMLNTLYGRMKGAFASTLIGGNSNSIIKAEKINGVDYTGLSSRQSGRVIMLGGSRNTANGDYLIVGGGSDNQVFANNSVVLGSKNTVGKVDKEKVGYHWKYNNIDRQDNVYILGSNVDASNVSNAVVFGDNSTAVANAISVGSSGENKQRQIKFVAKGTDNTDAVNVKQLNDALDGVGADLSNYYKKTETYSQSEVDSKLGTKVDNSAFDSYKGEVSTALDSKANLTADNLTPSHVGQWQGKLGINDKADKTDLTAVAKATSADIDVDGWKNKLGVTANDTNIASKANLTADNLTPAHVGQWQTKLDLVNNTTFNTYKGQVTTALDAKADKTALTPLAKKDASNLTTADVNAWKAKIGSGGTVDLSDYYNKTEVNNSLNGKANINADNITGANIGNWQSKLGVNDKADKTDLTAVAKATSAEIDVNEWKNKLGVTANDVNIASKANLTADNLTPAHVGQWQTKLDLVNNTTFNTYKGQVTTALDAKADKTALTPLAKKDASNLTTADVNAWKAKIGSGGTVDLSDYYNKTEVNNSLNGKANINADNINGANIDNWQSKLGVNDKADKTDLTAVAKATSAEIDVNEWKNKLGVTANDINIASKANLTADNLTPAHVGQWQTKLDLVNNTTFNTYKGQVTTALDAKADKTALTPLAKKDASNLTTADVNAWKAKIGSGGTVDLSDYYNKTEVNNSLNGKANINADNINGANIDNWQGKLGVNDKVDKSAFTAYRTQAENDLKAVAKATSADIDVDAWKTKLGVGTGGTGPVDLSNYYTKSETYNRSEVDGKLANKVDNSTFTNYQTDVTNQMATKVDNTTFTAYQSDVTNQLATKVDNTTFTDYQTQVTNDLATKASRNAANLDAADVSEWQRKLGVGMGGVDMSNYYTKNETDAELQENIAGDINANEERGVKGKVIDSHLRANYARKDDININRQQIINNANHINEIEDELSSGIAATAAMEQAPYVSGKWTYAAGAAHYNGESAVGATLRKTANSGRWSMTFGGATSSQGESLFRVGVSGVLD